MKKNVLLVNPKSALDVYKDSKVTAAVPRLPVMSLAMLASVLLKEGVEVRIIDLAVEPNPFFILEESVKAFLPDFVGVTSTTPLFFEAANIAQTVHRIKNDAILIAGGPHPSALPEECLKTSSFDIIVIGEGETTIKEIISGVPWGEIKGVAFRQNGKIIITQERELAKSLDDLPLPALHLFDISRYSCPRMIARHNPVGPIEISRGCVFNCTFCNKKVHGRRFRVKTPERVIEELLILKKLGYREFHVLDDQFTTDIDKAKEICLEIIRNKINMTWNLRTGVRVDRIDKEFLELAKRSGCYQLGIGFESGNQDCLDRMKKGIELKQAIKAAQMIRKVGIELVGFFILGFPGETTKTMEETIKFAIKLNLDYAKATILVPFPGTEIYDEFEKKGLIKTKDWSKYNFHNAHEIYQHPSLSWDCLNYYYDLFHRCFYLRPNYLIKRGWKSIIQGRLFDDLLSGYQTFFGDRALKEESKVDIHADR